MEFNITLKSICVRFLASFCVYNNIDVNELKISKNLKIEIFKHNAIKHHISGRRNTGHYCHKGHFICIYCGLECKDFSNLFICDNFQCIAFKHVIACVNFQEKILYVQNINKKLLFLINKDFFCKFCKKFSNDKNGLFTLCTSSENMKGNFPQCSFD